MKIIINSSTFKETQQDKITDVINNLVDNLIENNQSMKISILKPMSASGEKYIKSNKFDIYCYRYFFVNKYQTFSSIGIKPSIQNNFLNIFKLLFLLISQYFSLNKLVKKIKPDLIYAHWFFPQAIITYLIAKKHNVKFAFTSHGSDVQIINNLGPIGKKIVRTVAKKSYKYTAVSQLTLSEINKNFKKSELQPDKYKVIPMGIDEKYFDVVNKTIMPSSVKPTLNIIYVGRLIDYKGVDLIINVLSDLKNRNIKANLNILGTGILEEKLKQLSINLGLSNNVSFHGFKNFEEKLELIKSSDLFIVPSRKTKLQLEGGPLTLIEAMAVGGVCLVSDSIGFISYCTENNSLIFESDNIESLNLKINEFLKMDENKIKSIKNNAYETSKFFKFSNIGKLHYEFLIKNLEINY